LLAILSSRYAINRSISSMQCTIIGDKAPYSKCVVPRYMRAKGRVPAVRTRLSVSFFGRVSPLQTTYPMNRHRVPSTPRILTHKSPCRQWVIIRKKRLQRTILLSLLSGDISVIRSLSISELSEVLSSIPFPPLFRAGLLNFIMTNK